MAADPNTVGAFLENMTVSMVSVIIALVGFWTTFIKGLVNRKEVEDMIKNQSPYAQDRQFILERLNANKENQKAFSDALQRNTEVMNELRIQMATLTNTLEALEKRIEE